MNGCRKLVLAALMTASSVMGTVRADEPGTDALAAQVAAITAELDPRVAAATARIDGLGRQLLALRSYLRSGSSLAERWSWTGQQIAAFEGSPEHLALRDAIERVCATFTAANPGYELWVNPQVRSLDVQLAQWNDNESVTAASDAMLLSVREFAASPGFANRSPAADRDALKQFLVSFTPEPVPTVAAPGLSPHGQMRAVDFQVQGEGKIVAGPEAASIPTDWEAAGWAARLDAAVRASGRRFVGPLAVPNEPWHYTYTPDAVAVQP